MKTPKESIEVWNQRMKDYKESGKSLSVWCKENNISKSAMNYYLYDKPRYEKQKRNAELTTNLIPVIVKEDTIPTVCIEFGKASITVDESTDVVLLKKIIGALCYD